MHADPRAGQHTPIIEPLSLDEAYLDVTENLKVISSATQIAEEIRARIGDETELSFGRRLLQQVHGMTPDILFGARHVGSLSHQGCAAGQQLTASPAADATESNVSLARPEPLYECATDGAQGGFRRHGERREPKRPPVRRRTAARQRQRTDIPSTNRISGVIPWTCHDRSHYRTPSRRAVTGLGRNSLSEYPRFEGAAVPIHCPWCDRLRWALRPR